VFARGAARTFGEELVGSSDGLGERFALGIDEEILPLCGARGETTGRVRRGANSSARTSAGEDRSARKIGV
jgi:hypothetical protein